MLMADDRHKLTDDELKARGEAVDDSDDDTEGDQD